MWIFRVTFIVTYKVICEPGQIESGGGVAVIIISSNFSCKILNSSYFKISM